MIHGSDSYRADSGWGAFGVFLLILAITVAATISLVSFIPNEAKNIYGVMAWVVMIGVGLIGTFIAVVVAQRMRRRAIARLTELLGAEGFTIYDHPTAAQSADIINFLRPMVLFENIGNAQLEWYALRGGPADQSIVAQHIVITGSGKYTRTHERTIVALPFQNPFIPQTKPQIWFRRRAGQLYRIEGTAEGPDVEIGDPVLDKAFIIQCPGNAAAVRTLVTPEVHRLLASGPKYESWSMAGGYICCIFSGMVRDTALRAMLRRTEEMRTIWRRN